MSSSSKTLLFAAVLTVGVCAASLYRKPPGTTATAQANAPMTHRLDGPRVVVGPALSEFASPASDLAPARPAAPRASMLADGASNAPPAFPDASPIGNFSLGAPPPWSRDERDGSTDAPSNGGRRLHHVEDGDTLALLAQRYLGSAARASEIHAANRTALPASGALPIGIDLVIPPTTGVPRALDRTVPAEPASTRSTFDPQHEPAAVSQPAGASPLDNPAWMSEPTPPPQSNPVAPGVIRPASEPLR